MLETVDFNQVISENISVVAGKLPTATRESKGLMSESSYAYIPSRLVILNTPNYMCRMPLPSSWRSIYILLFGSIEGNPFFCNIGIQKGVSLKIIQLGALPSYFKIYHDDTYFYLRNESTSGLNTSVFLLSPTSEVTNLGVVNDVSAYTKYTFS